MSRQVHMMTRVNFYFTIFFAFLIEDRVFVEEPSPAVVALALEWLRNPGANGWLNNYLRRVRRLSPFLAANNHVRCDERREPGMLLLSETGAELA